MGRWKWVGSINVCSCCRLSCMLTSHNRCGAKYRAFASQKLHHNHHRISMDNSERTTKSANTKTSFNLSLKLKLSDKAVSQAPASGNVVLRAIWWRTGSRRWRSGFWRAVHFYEYHQGKIVIKLKKSCNLSRGWGWWFVVQAQKVRAWLLWFTIPLLFYSIIPDSRRAVFPRWI